jgi:L-methionine (R)-S-oxide reductase
MSMPELLQALNCVVMVDDLNVAQGTKEEQYLHLIPQILSVIEGGSTDICSQSNGVESCLTTPLENDLIANLANISAILKEQFNWWWVGFYIVKGEQLVLGPFQGPVACTRIKKGKGVCGTAWAKVLVSFPSFFVGLPCFQAETLVVEDVDQFPGHIACSSKSRSEIVVPLCREGVVGLPFFHSSFFCSPFLQ